MRSGLRLDRRYQIPDEPQRPMWAKIVITPFFQLPLTIYLTLAHSWFFALLPGVNGLLVNGNHKWRDILLSVIALVLLVVGSLTGYILTDEGVVTGLAADYVRDFVLALFLLPLLKVLTDQQRTMELRRAVAQC